MEGLKNMMEDNVERTLDKLLPTMPHICSCNDCRLDMATYALNRLHPKYGRTNTGAILHRFDTSSAQAEAEILEHFACSAFRNRAHRKSSASCSLRSEIIRKQRTGGQ